MGNKVPGAVWTDNILDSVRQVTEQLIIVFDVKNTSTVRNIGINTAQCFFFFTDIMMGNV